MFPGKPGQPGHWPKANRISADRDEGDFSRFRETKRFAGPDQDSGQREINSCMGMMEMADVRGFFSLPQK
jgi:hypothetical protein